MNEKYIHSTIIGLLVIGLLLSGGGVYLLNNEVRMVANSVKELKGDVMNMQQAPASQVQASVQAPKATYVSCRYEHVHLDAATNWGDAKLLCTDGGGKESVILTSIDEKFGLPADSNIDSIHFVPQGQTVYVHFRGEEDVASYGLSYFNIQTGATGDLLKGSIKVGEYIPEESAHFSGNGQFLAFAGGKKTLNPEYVDLQTIYLYDLRSAKLVTTIPASQGHTFLARTCFRSFGDFDVKFTDDKMTYTSYNEPIKFTQDDTCSYKSVGGIETDFNLPR